MTIEVTCQVCAKTFPSPFEVSGADDFDATELEGMGTSCPYCGSDVEFSKATMRARFGDGGFVGDKT